MRLEKLFLLCSTAFLGVGFISNSDKRVSKRKKASRVAQSSAPSVLISVTPTAVPRLGWTSADLGRPVRAVLRRARAQLTRPSTFCQRRHHAQTRSALWPLHSSFWQYPGNATRWRHAPPTRACRQRVCCHGYGQNELWSGHKMQTKKPR